MYIYIYIYIVIEIAIVIMIIVIIIVVGNNGDDNMMKIAMITVIVIADRRDPGICNKHICIYIYISINKLVYNNILVILVITFTIIVIIVILLIIVIMHEITY